MKTVERKRSSIKREHFKMSGRLNIVGGKIWVEGRAVERGISIVDEYIERVDVDERLPPADEVFDAEGLLLLPGLIDVHVHLRDSNLAYKEDFVTGTSSAVAGGFTTVLDMPNTDPPITTYERLKNRISIAEQKILCDVGFYATPDTYEDVERLAYNGCIAVKIYMHHQLGEIDYNSSEALIRLGHLSKKAGVLIAVHAEDPDLVSTPESGYDAEDHARCHPSEAEVSATRRALNAAYHSGSRLHICHLSTAETLEEIREARMKGVDVSCEATAHHTLLSQEDFRRLGRLAVVEPPLRTKKDSQTIMEGVLSGLIDILASDHAPHTLEEKFASDPKPGYPGCEISFPLYLKLMKDERRDFGRIVDALTVKPAERFGLKDVGRLEPGYLANIAVFDLNEEWRIDAKHFISKAKYSPFDRYLVRGRFRATFVRGRLVFKDGRIVGEPGVGRIVLGDSFCG